jgi:hypothetical protein
MGCLMSEVTVSADDVRLVTDALTLATRHFGSQLVHIPGFGAALEASGRLSASAERSALPDDPVTSMDTVALTHHEMMAAYERAGFDHSEAFSIVLTYITANASASAMRSAHG